ncbi:hypothetical protein EYF80_007789 [Liparis tanakae]|uniref:Uncharacterized protein n=1 Tax=Liparis tanakae TaxID=230148 RepID=A0A4Z2IVM9_9TELE|nr:hypothetical protein EYF80_007789 [Liparis tanakae]
MDTTWLQRRAPCVGARQGALEGRIPAENGERGGTQRGGLESRGGDRPLVVGREAVEEGRPTTTDLERPERREISSTMGKSSLILGLGLDSWMKLLR